MRIRYLSDLHLELDGPPSSFLHCGEDVVVLAGDIDVGTDGVRWAIKTFPNCPVIYVPGNHEFYLHHFHALLSDLKATAAGTNVHVLENETVLLGGVRFAGCTLWTDFNLLGSDKREKAMRSAMDSMNDFHVIWSGPLGQRRSLRAEEVRARHLMSVEWLQREIAASAEPVVVVTHHAPCGNTSHPRFAGDLLSPAFASDLEQMMEPPVKAWIFGHTHYCCDRFVNGVRVVSNQRGYPRESLEGFAWNRCIEITIGAGGMQA